MPSLRIEVSGQVVVARLTDAIVRVGSDAGCDLRIDDKSVSANHVEIEPLPGGGHKLTDLNTGRPTKVNGLVVKRVSLKPGDVIEVGPARITYDPENAPFVTGNPAAVPAAPRPPIAPSIPRPMVVPAPAVPMTPAVPSATTVVPAVSASARSVDPLVDTVSASPPATPPAPSAAEALPQSAPSSRPSARAGSSSSKLKIALVATGAFAIVALIAAAIIRSDSGSGAAELRALGRDLENAKTLASTDVDRALAEFDRLSHAPSDGVRNTARNEAEYWRARVRDSDRDLADLERQAGKMDPEAVASELAILRQKYGAGIFARHAGIAERLETTRKAAAEARVKAAVDSSRGLADAGKFREALDLWNSLLADTPGDDAARRVADDERQGIEAKAIERFKTLAAEVDALGEKVGPAAAALRLRGAQRDFAGTSVSTAIDLRARAFDAQAAAVAAAELTARLARAAPIVQKGPTPTAAGPTPGAGTPPAGSTAPPASSGSPSGSGTSSSSSNPSPREPELPPPSSVNRARLVTLLADADAKAAARRFREALALLLEAEKFAEGTSEAKKLALRKDDLDLARQGLDLLIAAIKAHKERFGAVEIAPRYVVALVDADTEMVTAAVRGGTTQTRWSAFDAPHMASLVEAAAIAPKDALPLAGLLFESGSHEAAEKTLLRVTESGGDKAAVDARLAHWRGEPVPLGGYVTYKDRLVSLAERTRLELADRIVAACVLVASPDPKQRKVAYDELLSIGEPAKEAFGKALRARREAATKEIAGSKALTSGRTKQSFLEELEKRRAAALALIDDEKAYPYPYAPDQDQRQKRVDDLVDAVREVWERPFDLVSTWDKAVAESLSLVREVDDVLTKVEEGYVADLDATKAEISKAIHVPAMVLDAYDKDVLAFNERVATSATREEKENVRLVNRYRMMMGRQAVRIEERLERASRGHSIEMRIKDYFAHESPTPGLETPGKRCAREGYSAGTGENIAWSSGLMSAQGAFDGWYHSSGHHRNMLGKGWTEMGVGRSMRNGAATYWTQNFGAMGGKSLKPPDPLPPPRDDVAPEKDPETAEPPAAGSSDAPGDGGNSGG